ncbi:MAG: WD40 repeat domain-containing protein, partial [Nitrospira sp.]
CDSHEGWVTSAAITLNGRYAALSFSDRRIELWDVSDGLKMHEWSGHHFRAATAIAASNDGGRVVSGARSTLRLWTEHNAARIWSRRGDRATISSGDSVSHQGEWRREGIGNPIAVLALTKDGQQAVSGHYDGLLKLWALDENPKRDNMHSAKINSLLTTPDKAFIVSASDDSTLRVWSVSNGQPVFTLRGHKDSVQDVAACADGMITSVSKDGTLGLWPLQGVAGLGATRRGEVIKPKDEFIDADLPEQRKEIFRIVSCESRVVCATYNHSILVLDQGGEKPRQFAYHPCYGPISTLTVTPDGRCAITGHWTSRIVVRDLDSGEIRQQKELHADRAEALMLAGDGGLAFIGCRNGQLHKWDLTNDYAACVWQAPQHCSIKRIVCEPSGRRALLALDDKTLVLWDSESGQPQSLEGHENKITDIGVTPDWRLAVSGSDDRTIKLWDLETCRSVASFTCDGAITCVLAADEEIFVAGDDDGAVHVLSYIQFSNNDADTLRIPA